MSKLTYLAVIIALTAGLAAGYWYFENSGNGNEKSIKSVAFDRAVTVYKGKYCGCCNLYIEYLRSRGYKVDVVEVQNIIEMHGELGIPSEMASCHISVTNGYIVVGHVPVEAIDELLKNKPHIKGISLPGMPSGSPGMPGEKKGPFVIYILSDSGRKVFMKL